ncbi:unnamed protein product [Parnassius apollo]|uniref:(apollo) hypothetical protein n=1 Tax=Parnassius apollo TaxID=110799 RepID=A0A8S3WH20_PARAO|nr:unnamed protein product [Parnassius apollo]
MRLKRTPPSQQPKSDTNQSSAAATATDTDNDSSSNVASRPRGRKRQHDDEVYAFMSDMKQSFDTLKNQQVKILSSISDIQKQNGDIIKSMDFISKQYDEIKDRLCKMETERKTHLAYIQTLELKVENLERFQKQASIEIKNIPVKHNETKDDLLQIVNKVGLVTNTHIEDSLIRDRLSYPVVPNGSLRSLASSASYKSSRLCVRLVITSAFTLLSSMDEDEILIMYYFLKRRKMKQEMKRRYWVHPMLMKRIPLGLCQSYIEELKSDDGKFYEYLRMTVSTFDSLLARLADNLRRENTHFRNCISAEERLVITLR